MEKETCWVASADQVSCELQGDIAILNLKDSTYYGLNPIGARVWQLLQTPMTLGQLQQSILSEYDTEPERAERDLIALLAKLESHQLITIHHASDQ